MERQEDYLVDQMRSENEIQILSILAADPVILSSGRDVQ